MNNVVFIPVRGGSKSIPLKNIKLFKGMPLVYWAIKASCECEYVKNVYVATDSEIICEIVSKFNFPKLNIISRSIESASDTASTELAMLEFSEKYSFDNICLVQATSPLLKASDLDKGFLLFESGNIDSVISVVKQKRFIWDWTEKGYIRAQNYDIYHRPRRQEFEGYFVENGAFYITSREQLLKTQNRISGKIIPCEMDENTYFEIDEPSDWAVLEAIMSTQKSLKPMKKIKMFLTDCDGVLTDGGMYYTENGDEIKKFNTRDGMGLSILHKQGIITGIITSETTKIVRNRGVKLKIDEILIGVNDKLSAARKLAEKYDISLAEIAYIGDDINDITLLKNVGISACPFDAMEEVKNIVDYVSPQRGGDGVVRDFIHWILQRVDIQKEVRREKSSIS